MDFMSWEDFQRMLRPLPTFRLVEELEGADEKQVSFNKRMDALDAENPNPLIALLRAEIAAMEQTVNWHAKRNVALEAEIAELRAELTAEPESAPNVGESVVWFGAPRILLNGREVGAPENPMPAPEKRAAQIPDRGLLFGPTEGRYRGLGFCDSD
jgi:hypothetical protein